MILTVVTAAILVGVVAGGDDCPALAEAGECVGNVKCPDVVQKCKQDCQSKGKCKDDNPFCECWASIGECRQNPEWMLPNCPKCCEAYADVENSAELAEQKCVKWAKEGACERNHLYMWTKCKDTCMEYGQTSKKCQDDAAAGKCTSVVGCLDTGYFCTSDCMKQAKCSSNSDPTCECRASIGECKADTEYMQEHCKDCCEKYADVANTPELQEAKCKLWSNHCGKSEYMKTQCAEYCKT